MTQLRTFLTRLRSYFKTGNIKALKEAFIAGSHLLMVAFKVTIVILLIVKFYKINNSNSYTLKPFSVPEELIKSGFTGETVIKKIMDERQKILYYNDSSTSQSRIFFRATSKKNVFIETKIEESKESGPLDIDGIFKAGKKLLNYNDKIISGEITKFKKNHLILKIYMPNGLTENFTQRIEDIDILFKDAAEFITQQTTPQYLAEYLIKKSVRSNDSATLVETVQLLEKADKLLRTLEYNTAKDKEKQQDLYVQLIACRTSWHLAKAIKLSTQLRGFNLDRKDSLKWKNEYDACFENAWKQGDSLKSSNDLAYYVLKLSTLMSVVNSLSYNDANQTDHYKERSQILINECLDKSSLYSTRIWSNKSDYFEDNQANGFINLSIGYLSYRLDLHLDKYSSKYYLQKAIKCFHKENSVLWVDNNEIAAINSLAYFYKNKAQFEKDSNKNIVKYKENYINAQNTFEEALQANKGDGNIYDSYAELIYDLNDKKANESFYEKIRAALAHSKPVDGIAVANYWKDTRWQELVKSDVEFRKILDSFDVKKNIKADVQKTKKNKSDAAP